MKISFFITISLLCLCCSCKKNTNEPEQQPDHFSFVYNGSTYNYSITNNISSGGVIKNADHTAGILIDMPAVFNGIIIFSHPNCAYLEPFDTAVYDDGDCHLSIKNSYGDFEPIDSTQIFIYQSGALNISFSNCSTKTETDLLTGATNQYEECMASGTFDLTLVNKNSQTIKITNGIANFNGVR